MKNILGSLLLCCLFTAVMGQGNRWTATDQPLTEVAALKKQITKPLFRDKDYVITAYGAQGDGITKNTAAIKKAIEICHAEGGGRVVVPKGTFLTGAIHLKSNVNLHLEDQAVILFSRDSSDYPMVKTRWEGSDCINFSPFIYAYEQENIAITGKGLLNGNANKDHWWYWVGNPRYGWNDSRAGNQRPARKLIHQYTAEQRPVEERVFGHGHFLRPTFIQPYKCKNVWIADVEVIDGPMWNLNPVLCENVLIERVRVIAHGPNNDGCNPEASKNVWIRDCYFDTGDDCIAIKSGRDADGRNIGRPAENYIIENCIMKDGHGGVVIGSEIAGGARNIYALNNTMDSPQLDRALRIKTNSMRGGIIENVFFYNTAVGQYKDAAVRFNMFYDKEGAFIPTIRNVWVENLVVTKGGEYAVRSKAYAFSPVTDLTMINCKIDGVEKAYDVDHLKNVNLKNVEINGKMLTSFE